MSSVFTNFDDFFKKKRQEKRISLINVPKNLQKLKKYIINNLEKLYIQVQNNHENMEQGSYEAQNIQESSGMEGAKR